MKVNMNIYFHSSNTHTCINISPWASYQIRKIAGCACTGNAGNVFLCLWLQRKPLINDSGMHHGTCVMHVPWCMSGSLISGGGENAPGIPGACATPNFTNLAKGPYHTIKQGTLQSKYSLLMHCIKIKSRAKSLLNEQYVFVGGNISFLCVLSCISEEA